MAAEKITEGIAGPVPQTYPYDAIFVLGASMVWDTKFGKWSFPNIIEGEGLVGGKSRIIAAVQAIEEELAPVILITGGVERNERHVGFRSVAFRNEMLRRGVEPSRVQIMEHGDLPRGNTQGNILDIADFLEAHPEVRRIGILTNKFHRARGEAFVAITDMHGVKIEFIEAEELLIRRHPRFGKWAQRLQESPILRERVKKERQGIRALRNGTYQPTHS